MEALPTETLLHVFRLLEVSDLVNLSRTCSYYAVIGQDERLWKHLFSKTFVKKQKKDDDNVIAIQPAKGWHSEYKKHQSIGNTKDLVELVFKGATDIKRIKKLLSASWLTFNHAFFNLASKSIQLTGDNVRLEELIQSKQGSIAIDKRTGIWDYGRELISVVTEYNQKRMYNTHAYKGATTARPLASSKNGANLDMKSDVEFVKKLKHRQGQFKSIEKNLYELTRKWQDEWCSFTALHWAALGGHLATIQTLINHGANVMALTSNARSACDIAIGGGHVECAEYLTKNMAKLVSEEDFVQLEDLIVAGDALGIMGFINSYLVNHSLADIDGSIISTILYKAIDCNNPKILEILFTSLSIAGNTPDSDGNTPVHVAAARGHLECLQVAIDRCTTQIDTMNKALQTPLMLAVTNGHIDSIQLLLEYGSLANTQGSMGMSALHRAVGNPQVLDLVLQEHINVLDRDIQRRNTIHRAAIHGSIEEMASVIHGVSGKDLNAPDNARNTALHLAVLADKSGDHSPIIALLLRSGAKSTFTNITGLTPRQLCIVEHKPHLLTHFGDEPEESILSILGQLPGHQSHRIVCRLAELGRLDSIADITPAISSNAHKAFIRYKSEEIHSEMLTSNITLAKVQDLVATMRQLNVGLSSRSTEQVIAVYLASNRLDLVQYLVQNMEVFTYLRSTFISNVMDYILRSSEARQLELIEFIDILMPLILAQDVQRADVLTDEMIQKDAHVVYNAAIRAHLVTPASAHPHFIKTIQHGAHRCGLLLAQQIFGARPAGDQSELIIKATREVMMYSFKNGDEFKKIVRGYNIPAIDNPLRFSLAFDHSYYPTPRQQGLFALVPPVGAEDQTPTPQCCTSCNQMTEDLQDHLIVCPEALTECPNHQYASERELLVEVYLIKYSNKCEIAKSANRHTPLSQLDTFTMSVSFARTVPAWLKIFLVFFGAYWLIKFFRFFSSLRSNLEIKAFYNNVLKISEVEVQTVEWNEVVAKIEMVPRLFNIRQNMTALDIANRIMRKENYIIAIINREILDLSIPLPFLGKYKFMTKTLEWSLKYSLYNYVFGPNGQVKQEFTEASEQERLIRGLTRRFKIVGVISFFAAPFTFFFLLLTFFFKYAEEFKNKPGALGSREWSPLAKWKFREFNELPHTFDKSFVSFVLGSVLAIFLVFGVYSDDFLFAFDIFGQRPIWYIGIFGTGVAICKALIPEENQVFEPTKHMARTVQHTHYIPKSWRGKSHTHTVRDEFVKLFEYRVVDFLREVASILFAPLILMISLPRSSRAILNYISHLTIKDDDLGYVCSYGVFTKVEKLGSRKYGSTHDADKFYKTKQGKLEKSIVNFATANQWIPAEKNDVLDNLRSFVHETKQQKQHKSSMSEGGTSSSIMENLRNQFTDFDNHLQDSNFVDDDIVELVLGQRQQAGPKIRIDQSVIDHVILMVGSNLPNHELMKIISSWAS
eukprot:gene9830-11482_t